MKATEAKRIAREKTNIDHSDIILSRIKIAASRGKYCIDVEYELMNYITKEKLESLGYLISLSYVTYDRHEKSRGGYQVSWW